MAAIRYQDVVQLVDELTPAEQQALLIHLQERTHNLTNEERKALFRASILNVPLAEEPSPRREDWYADDGR
jgi:hypothetical protein